ncbi:hypothetical protein V6Z11_A13G042900 [Gossypium hirsutum]
MFICFYKCSYFPGFRSDTMLMAVKINKKLISILSFTLPFCNHVYNMCDTVLLSCGPSTVCSELALLCNVLCPWR